MGWVLAKKERRLVSSPALCGRPEIAFSDAGAKGSPLATPRHIQAVIVFNSFLGTSFCSRALP